MGFLGRWISDAVRLGLCLGGALLFMQAPALSHDYAAALLQVADAQNRDIAAREDVARGFYSMSGAPREELMARLREREPANHAGLVQSRAEADAVAEAAGRIGRAAPVLRPLAAAWDLAAVPHAGKRAVAGQAVQSFVPAVQLSAAALWWALAGVVVGSLLAQAVLLPVLRVPRRA